MIKADIAGKYTQDGSKITRMKTSPKYFFFKPNTLSTLFDEKVLNEETMLPGGMGLSECYIPSRRGFPQFVEAPRLQLDKRFVAAKRDFSVFKAIWFVSGRAKRVFESIDPTAFEFCRCDTELAGGSSGPEYWLCKVLPALDAVDEQKSKLTIRTEPNGNRYYSFGGGTSLVFKPEVIGGHHIFALAYSLSKVVCDEAFKDACEAEKLTGLLFRRLGS
jgi:Protein of unknown function (DUF1629)